MFDFSQHSDLLVPSQARPPGRLGSPVITVKHGGVTDLKVKMFIFTQPSLSHPCLEPSVAKSRRRTAISTLETPHSLSLFFFGVKGQTVKCLFTGLAPWRPIALAFCCTYTNAMLRALSPSRSRSSLTLQQHRGQRSP